MSFATLGVDLVAKISSFEENMTKARTSVDSLDKRFGVLSSTLRGFGAGLVGALSVGGLAAFAKTGLDAADSLNDMSDRLGVSVRDLASFKLAATLADTSLEGVGAGIARLTRSIGEAEAGNTKLAGVLQELGITARDPKEAFFQLADATQRITDPAQRAALLNQVLGKSYQDLVPLLQQGGDGLRKSARDSESFADAMARLAPNAGLFNDELDRMKQSAAGAGAAILERLVPGLADTATRVRELMDDDKGIQALVRAYAGIGKLPFDLIIGDITSAETATERIKELNKELAALERSLKFKTVGNVMPGLWVKSLPELEREILVRKNQIEAMEKFGDQAYERKAAEQQQDIADTVNYSNDLQEALRKAFSVNPLDDFLAKFKDRRKAIADEYRALQAELDGAGSSEASSLDVTSQITIGRSALAAGNFEAAQAAAAAAKSQLKKLAAQDGLAGFEESYFLRELERLETDVLNSTEQTAAKVQQALQEKLSVLTNDATQLTVEVDGAAIIGQVKRAIDQIKKDLAADPLRVPIVAVPTVSPDGRQLVDLSQEALKYGRRN